MKIKTVTIFKIKYVEKWAEIWTDDLPGEGSYDECCKIYKLEQCVEAAGLNNYVLNFGFRGLTMQWKLENNNYEPDHFILTADLLTKL